MDENSNLHVDRMERSPQVEPLALITLSFARRVLTRAEHQLHSFYTLHYITLHYITLLIASHCIINITLLLNRTILQYQHHITSLVLHYHKHYIIISITLHYKHHFYTAQTL